LVIISGDDAHAPDVNEEAAIVQAMFDLLDISDATDDLDSVLEHYMDSIQEGFQHCTRMEHSMLFEHHQMIANFSFTSQNFQIVRQCIDHFTETNSENGANNFLMPAVENNDNPKVALRYKDFLVEINVVYFATKLKEMIEDLFQTPQDFDLTDNDFLFKKLAYICDQYTPAFRQFYRHIARQMIEHHFPNKIQVFLDQLLAEIKSNKSKNDYIDLYAEEGSKLYTAVRTIDQAEFMGADCRVLVEGLLRKTRRSNVEDFVIAVTHFNTYIHLLGDAC